jgi:hypothetical protein
LKFLILSVFIGLAGQVSGCGGSKPQTEEDIVPKRSSGKINRALAVKKYRDFAPVLSSDGQKLAYLSGRDQKSIRAYLFTDSDASPKDNKPVAILGEESFGEELEVSLSGDASLSAISYFKDGQNDLAVKFLNGEAKVIKLTANAEVESSPSFSSDTKLLAFGSGSLRGGVKDHLYVATISAIDQVIGTPTKIGSIDPYTFGPIWSTSENAIFIGRLAKDSGKIELEKISFSDSSQPTSYSAADISLKFQSETTIKPDRESFFRISDSKLYFTQMVSASERAKTGHIGSHESFDQQFIRDRRLVSVLSAEEESLTTGTAAKIDPPGFSIQSFSVSKSGFIATSVRQFLICKDQTEGKFIQGIQFIDDSSTTAAQFSLVPSYDKESGGWTASGDYCPAVEPVAEGEEAKPITNFPDHYIREIAVNAGGTNTSFTIAYTSHFYFGQQSGEGIVLGDPEVYLIKASSAADKWTYTVKSVAPNTEGSDQP